MNHLVWIPILLSTALAGSNRYEAAAAYLESKNGHAMLVYQDGKLVFERYFNGWSAGKPHRLASGTKSFTGAMLAAAVEDGIVTLDERVSATLDEWKDDPKRATITVGELLSLTSGIDGGSIGVVPEYAEAVEVAEVRAARGKRFSYGPVPFQLFGEIMRRKLAGRKPAETVKAYMKRRVLDPIDCKPAAWREGKSGEIRLPSGCAITAREWAAFGQLMLNHGRHGDKQVIAESALAPCFKGSKANSRYGLGFWLNKNTDFPKDLVMAAGMGKQKLYIVPSQNLLVVQFAEARGFAENVFLAKLFGSKEPPSRQEDAVAERRRPLFDRLDRDGNGQLSPKEWDRKQWFEKMDANRDGKLDWSEFKDFRR